MTIANDLVETFLKCPTKCFLRSRGESVIQSKGASALLSRLPRARIACFVSQFSTTTRECFQHSLRPDWQMTQACTGGGKDCVCNRGRDRRRRRLAKTDRCFCARKKLDFDFGHVSHTQHSIGIEIRILRLPCDELRALVQGQGQAPQSGEWMVALPLKLLVLQLVLH